MKTYRISTVDRRSIPTFTAESDAEAIEMARNSVGADEGKGSTYHLNEDDEVVSFNRGGEAYATLYRAE